MPLVDPSASVVRCARIVIVFAATIFEGYLTKTGPQARWKGVAGPVVRFEGSLRVDSNGFLVKDFLASGRPTVAFAHVALVPPRAGIVGPSARVVSVVGRDTSEPRCTSARIAPIFVQVRLEDVVVTAALFCLAPIARLIFGSTCAALLPVLRGVLVHNVFLVRRECFTLRELGGIHRPGRVDSNGFLVKDFLASVRGIVDAVFLDLFLDLILGRLLEDSKDGIFLLLVIHGQTSARCEKSESANQCERTKCHS